MAYGNTSTSALLNGIAAARNKQNAVNDQYAAYEWSTSAKTPEDYASYSAYLKGQASKTGDEGKKLTYSSKLQEAQGAFTSNEIQRQTIAVAYGEGDNTTKYNRMLDLYHAAVASGNYDQAQSLEAQLASLSKTIQNEGEAAAGKATADSKKQISLLLKQNSVAYDALIQSARTGQPIKDENGQVIKGRLVPTENGGLQVQYDDAGGPIKVTARQAAQARAVSLLQQKDILDQAIEAGLDEDGTYSTQKANLTASEDWAKYTSPQLLDALNKENGGSNPFTMRVDPTTGVQTPTMRAVTGFADDGTPVYRNGFATTNNLGSDSPVDLSFDRKVGTNPNDAKDNFTVQTFKTDDYNRELKDPVTGRVLYAGTSGKSILNPGLPGSIKQTKEDEKAGKPVGALDVLGAASLTPDLSIYAHPGELVKDLAGSAGDLTRSSYAPAAGVGRAALATGLGPLAGLVNNTSAAMSRVLALGARKILPAVQVPAKPIIAPAPAQLIAPKINPKSTAPITNILASAPRGATPQATVVNQFSALIDQAKKAQAATPAPAPAKKPWWKIW